ncbi:MAG: hypothetical protein WAQ52_19930 [Terriglobales bacterium]
MSDRSQFLAEIDKITGSSVLHGSESLCKLLRYLSKHTLAKPGVHLKEYQIATEVFGRPADFDPQADSTIRVQAGRLRGKLSEYYSSEGAEDPIVVELPRGSYVLQFHHRSHGNGKGHGAADYEPERSVASIARNRTGGWGIAIAVLSVLLTAALAMIVNLWSKNSETSLASGEPPAPAAFQVFWSPFVAGPEEPWVVFSNAAFIGRPETGMRYFDSKRDPRSHIWDHYTGVGEVLAVHELDQVFGALRHRIRVKRGSLFSLDDAKNNDLIFVGSPSENLTLLDIPGTREFVFQRVESGPRKGDLAVVNVHPGPGEEKAFLASPYSSPLTEDYSVVALMPGLNSVRSVMILAGTTTFGTQAAVEFVSRQNSVQALLSRLSVSKAGEMVPFEALLHVKVTRGVPVETELLAVRKRNQ